MRYPCSDGIALLEREGLECIVTQVLAPLHSLSFAELLVGVGRYLRPLELFLLSFLDPTPSKVAPQHHRLILALL